MGFTLHRGFESRPLRLTQSPAKTRHLISRCRRVGGGPWGRNSQLEPFWKRVPGAYATSGPRATPRRRARPGTSLSVSRSSVKIPGSQVTLKPSHYQRAQTGKAEAAWPRVPDEAFASLGVS